LFKTLELMGEECAGRLEHISFGEFEASHFGESLS
jgi:hypothetical protein